MRGWPVLPQSDAVIKDVADRLKIDLQGFHEALMLKRGIISPGPSEIPRVFDRYLKAAATLVEVVRQ
jgi:deoxyribodipyrimidine photolyase